ncbi:MAG: ABC transporter permease [Muribaculaceae bacterium]|nr:ABC transporter permease [Muribaculaceae bacterium]
MGKKLRIGGWFGDILRVSRKEFYLSFHDVGVIVFFVVLAFAYPVLYALIYNPEVARDVKVVVVDDDRSELSRNFVRSVDATSEANVIGYAANMEEARKAVNEKECYGIIYFPDGFSAEVERGQQGDVVLYTDMSLLMRYKQLLTAMTNVQQTYCSHIMLEKLPAMAGSGGAIIESREVPIGNTGRGIASAVLPAVLILVLQQSMLLGICMLRGGSRERRLRNGGRDPHDVGAAVGSTILGKTITYLIIYLIPSIYVLFIVPIMFSYPQNGNPIEILVFLFPFMLCASFMGQSLQVFVNERESTFLVLVFTSVIFIFLSGISWPRYAMGGLWHSVGNAIPSTWAANGYILMMTDGATLVKVQHHYFMLWGLAAAYFIIAYCVERFICRPRYKRMEYYDAKDPGSLLREEARRNGLD